MQKIKNTFGKLSHYFIWKKYCLKYCLKNTFRQYLRHFLTNYCCKEFGGFGLKFLPHEERERLLEEHEWVISKRNLVDFWRWKFTRIYVLRVLCVLGFWVCDEFVCEAVILCVCERLCFMLLFVWIVFVRVIAILIIASRFWLALPIDVGLKLLNYNKYCYLV